MAKNGAVPESSDATGLARAVREKLDVTSQRVSQRVRELRDAAPMNRAVALGLLGHEVGIGITEYLTDTDVAAVRELMSSGLADAAGKAPKRPQQEDPPDYAALKAELAKTRRELRAAQRAARPKISDDVLRQRCGDLLDAEADFDRAVNQALLVLEDRIRTMAGLDDEVIGRDLMGKAFKDDGPIVLSNIQPEQESAKLHFMGMYGMLRNPTGHRIVRTFDRDDAVAVVHYVDFLFRLLGRATARQ